MLQHNHPALLLINKSASKDFDSSPTDKNDTVIVRFGDINRNLLSLKSYNGHVINAGLNNDFFFEKMLSEAEKVSPEGTPALVVGASIKSRVSNLNADQQKEFLIEQIHIYNHGVQSERFINYCIAQGLTAKEIEEQKQSITEIIQSHNVSDYKPPIEPEFCKTAAQKILFHLLDRRAAGENLQTRLKSVIEIIKEPETTSLSEGDVRTIHPSDTLESVVLYYDRIAGFCQILLGPDNTHSSQYDEKNIHQILEYFSTQRPAEQSFFLQSPVEGCLPVHDLMAKQLLLSIDNNALTLKMKYSQVGMHNLIDNTFHFFYKNNPLKILNNSKRKLFNIFNKNKDRKKENIKKFADQLAGIEASLAPEVSPVEQWEQSFAQKIEQASHEHRVDIALTHEITATWDSENKKFKSNSDKIIVPEKLWKSLGKKVPADVNKFYASEEQGSRHNGKTLWGRLTNCLRGSSKKYHVISETKKNESFKQ